MRLTFTLEEAIPKGRARRGKGGQHYTPKRTRDYEAVVSMTALAAKMAVKDWPMDAKYEMKIAIPLNARGDNANIAKAIEDGCNKILFNDDRQVLVGPFPFRPAARGEPDVPCVCVEVTVL